MGLLIGSYYATKDSLTYLGTIDSVYGKAYPSKKVRNERLFGKPKISNYLRYNTMGLKTKAM